MLFEDWWMAKLRAKKEPLSLQQEIAAREAWNAAAEIEREACAKICAAVKATTVELGSLEGEAASGECLDGILERSNFEVSGLAPRKDDK